jgi:methylthioribose-1-phosphate isomerase
MNAELPVAHQPQRRADPDRPSSLPAVLSWVDEGGGALRVLDQTLLPERIELRTCRTAEEVWEAIRSLRVRGAPAIGVAAAYGLCVATRDARGLPREEFLESARRAGEYLITSRPTAVNLSWAVQRVLTRTAHVHGPAGAVWSAMLAEAHAIAREDAEVCRRIGEAGAALIPDGAGVLTHCNAGRLATTGLGTALAILYVARERGRRFRVYVDETRPLLQGSRLTALELAAAGIEVTVVCDGAAASLMKGGLVQVVVVGADRIAANGDVANKIGTYPLAVAARHHGIPFYVAAPLSTFDRTLASGEAIPIERRGEEELRRLGGRNVVADGAGCYNPAFDVTPAGLVGAIVTEKGVLEPVSARKIAGFLG